MLIEHPHIGDCYNADGMWRIMDAQFEFVASASWGEYRRIENNVNRGQSWHTTKIVAAESDSLETLKVWADKQQRDGAHNVAFYRTWEIKDGKFAGKRDNAQLSVSTHG